MLNCVYKAQCEMMSGVRDALMMTGLSFHAHALPGKRIEQEEKEEPGGEAREESRYVGYERERE